MMKLIAQKHGERLVVKLCFERFDASLVPEFKRQFSELVSPIPSDLVLDMSQVRFMDSSALGTLVTVHKSTAGARVRLVGMSSGVLGLLKLTRMDRVFEICDSLESIPA